MYTLESPTAGHFLYSTTLEDLREQLVRFHFANRRDPQVGDFADQFYAVYPVDESELDEGETVPEPRPLTKDLLIRLARYVWGIPDVELEETTTIRELAATLHYLFDMDTSAARDILRTYITQVEESDGRPIDEDEITRTDADFLIGCVKTARAAGDLCEGELAEVEKTATNYQGVQEEADTLRELRDNAIVAAVSAGASKADVARAAGISKQAVAKIVRRGQD